MDISEREKKYLQKKLSRKVTFNEANIGKDIIGATTFSFVESDNVAKDVKMVRRFCKKFGYDVLDINESGRDTVLIKVSKSRIPIIYWLTLLLTIVTIVLATIMGWYESPMFWIALFSFIAVMGMFIITQIFSEYFRDKELNEDEQKRRDWFIKLSTNPDCKPEDFKSEPNAVNDQLFATHNNRFSILTTIAAIAAASLVIVSFQTKLTAPLKGIISILMLMISIAVYAYALKMEQLIKRGERFLTNVYSQLTKKVTYKPQYNPLRAPVKPKYFIEKCFAVVDELPTILSIVVAVLILDIILIIWFFPSLIQMIN